jgi:hypothetical protein
LKIKLSKNKIIVAAVVVCVLAAAWFYGGNYCEKAAEPGQNPPAGTGITKPGEDLPPVTNEMYPPGTDPDAETGEQPAGRETGMQGEPGVFNGGSSKSETTEREAAKNAVNHADATPKTEGSQQQSNPAPEGKPAPAAWQEVTVDTASQLTCSLTVRCDDIFAHMDRFNQDKLEVLPPDGVIYPCQNVVFYEGESVFNVLQREMKKHKIHLEFVLTPLHSSHYIEGINNIYEFDCGELSGWTYKVNGWSPNYGCSCYLLQDGDMVEWVYSCDLDAEGLGGS